jgi:hypothetical protein
MQPTHSTLPASRFSAACRAFQHAPGCGDRLACHSKAHAFARARPEDQRERRVVRRPAVLLHWRTPAARMTRAGVIARSSRGHSTMGGTIEETRERAAGMQR